MTDPSPQFENSEHPEPLAANPAGSGDDNPGSGDGNADLGDAAARSGDAAARSGDAAAGPGLGRDPMETTSRGIRPHGVAEARRLATVAARVALENRASDVVVLDVTGQSAEFDFFVIATGTSRRQLHAVSEEIDDALEKGLDEHRLGIEGYQESNWIVLDYGSLVVHLFDAETREFYDLESLWADGQTIPLADLGLNADGSPADSSGDDSASPS